VTESDSDLPGGRNKVQKAVALANEPGREARPRVVASGRGTVAEQILQVAFANNIRVREDADLVEVLSAVDVDAEIPLEAMATVAEILAYVYRANGVVSPVLDPQCPPEETAR
jgi:flagellar biosynthesis protein